MRRRTGVMRVGCLSRAVLRWWGHKESGGGQVGEEKSRI